jgi:hypothetical protein
MDRLGARRSARDALRLLLTAALAVWLAVPARADEPWLLDDPALRVLTPADLAERPARFPFPVGERLVYDVTWFGVPAGTAEIEIARFVALGDFRYAHVVARAASNAVFSWVYPVRDRSEAWIDLDRFVTVRTRATQERPGKRYDESVHYDWDTHLLHARLDKLHKGQRRELTLDFGPYAHDTSDAVYRLRASPIAAGRSFSLPTWADRKLFELRIDVEAGKVLEVTPLGGRVGTLAVRPSTFLDGAPYAAGEGVVWVAGPTRIPVRLQGWIRTTEHAFLVRGLRATLVSYTAAAPGWPQIVAPPALTPDGGDTVVTRAGAPVWTPPAAVREARARSGQSVRDVRSRISSPAVSASPP